MFLCEILFKIVIKPTEILPNFVMQFIKKDRAMRLGGNSVMSYAIASLAL